MKKTDGLGLIQSDPCHALPKHLSLILSFLVPNSSCLRPISLSISHEKTGENRKCALW